MEIKWKICVMKIALIVVMILIAVFQPVKNYKDFIVSEKLNKKPKTIFLYDYNGNLIDTWDGIFTVEKAGDTVSLTGSNGSSHITGGIVVVEEN